MKGKEKGVMEGNGVLVETNQAEVASHMVTVRTYSTLHTGMSLGGTRWIIWSVRE